jgi:hypothetical protein
MAWLGRSHDLLPGAPFAGLPAPAGRLGPARRKAMETRAGLSVAPGARATRATGLG